MGLYIRKHLLRAPMTAFGVLLFVAVITTVLGSLHTSALEQQKNYEIVYDTIPVHVQVTNLMGTKTDDLQLPDWVGDLFTRWGLTPLVTDAQFKASLMIGACEEIPGALNLVGITSTQIVPSLLPESGATVLWRQGYSDEDLAGQENICLIPENTGYAGETVTLTFYGTPRASAQDKAERQSAQITLKIAGTYSGGSAGDIYCPYFHIRGLFSRIDKPFRLDAIRATLADNADLEALYDTRTDFFAAPNPTGEKTPWENPVFSMDTYYPYALDIDDRLLRQTAETLENSILINALCTILVFSLSAAGGVLVGWLTLRQRRRDISLLRTLGTSNASIYRGFALEQAGFLVLGIGIGGCPFGWEPRVRIGAFGVVYFLSLSAALLVLLNTNLLFTMKEDE